MKAEQLWAQKLAGTGSTLPRGKAFNVTSKPVAAAPKAKSAPKASAVKADPKPAAVSGLSEAQQGAMTELAGGDWVSVSELTARKQTLNALVKKGLLESREQGDATEYKLA